MEAYSLFLHCEKKLPNFFDLEPEVIKEALKLTDLDCEKILACQTVFHNHLPFVSHNVFEKVCSVFNDEPADFMHTQGCTPAEATWTVQCMRMLDPISPFSEQVLGYIAFVFYQEGFLTLPEQIAKETSEQGLKAQWFLDNYNRSKELFPDAKKNQQKMLQSIQEYCENKKQTVLKEVASVPSK
jgi:hypothetical protein